MLPKPTAKYVGHGPLALARLTHQFEGIDDIGFLAVQDAVTCLTPVEQAIYREQYLRLMKSRFAHRGEGA